MEILWIVAIIALVIGAVLLLAGYLMPGVSPEAVRAGWGLLILGIVLILVVVLVDELGEAGHDRDMLLGIVLLPLWRLLNGYRGREAVLMGWRN
jgi:hypothetical protein